MPTSPYTAAEITARLGATDTLAADISALETWKDGLLSTALTETNKAAQAKAVGDELASITSDVSALETWQSGLLSTALTETDKAAQAKKVGDEIDKLKSAFTQYTGNIITENLVWENGSINKDTGADASQSKSARTVGYIPFVGGDKYIVQCFDPDNVLSYVYVYQYSANDGTGYLGRTSSAVNYRTTAFTITTNSSAAYIRIVLYTNTTVLADKVPPHLLIIKESLYEGRFVEHEALSCSKLYQIPVSALNDKVKNTVLVNDDIELGAIQDLTGILITRNDRVRTKGYLFLKAGTVITESATPKFNAWEYDPVTLQLTETTAGWKTSYTVLHDSLVKMTWQTSDTTAVAGLMSFTNAFYVLDDSVVSPARTANMIFSAVQQLESKYDALLNTVKKHDLRVPGYIRQISHRGYRTEGAPQSTEPAYISAYYAGYQGIEGDIRVTSDGAYVMHHNATMPSDSTIAIADHTLEYLRENANMGTYNGIACEILTFEEFLNIGRRFDMDVYIDFKISLTQTVIEDLYAVIKKYGMEDRAVWLVSPNGALLVRNVYNNARVALYVSDGTVTEAMESLATNKNNTFVYPNFDVITENNVSAWRNAGLGVQCYFVDYNQTDYNTPALIREKITELISFGIDGIALDTYVPNAEYFDSKLAEWGIE